MEDIVDQSPDWRTTTLGGSSPNNKGPGIGVHGQSAKELLCCIPTDTSFMMEITITHPHNTAYLKLSSEAQKRKLQRIFQLTCAAIPVTYHKESKSYFEYDKHGQIHCHGWLKCLPFKHFPIGAISDMAKACLNCMPKRYAKFQDSCMFPDWEVYRAPPVKIKYDSITSDRIPIWEAYCKKLQ